MSNLKTDPADRLQAVQKRIQDAERLAGRSDGETVLVAVSKTFEADAIRPVLEAGQRVFGENRVQEAESKWPGLKQDFADAELHLIGPLQTNKIKPALAVFDVIQTVDREKLARKLAREMAAADRWLTCLIQINTGEEPQKAGVIPTDADAFIALCRDELGLPVKGVMCIPPADEAPGPHFALLAKIAARNDLSIISMGMSADFETAVQLGATHVRVGSAIFGARDYPPQ